MNRKATWPQSPPVLAMDGSDVGRRGLALLVGVVYEERALPIAWIVVKGGKGYFPEAAHVQLLAEVHTMAPLGADVMFSLWRFKCLLCQKLSGSQRWMPVQVDFTTCDGRGSGPDRRRAACEAGPRLL